MDARITRVENLYRVKIGCTGEIIEGEDFRSVLHCAMRCMKYYLHQCVSYEFVHAVVEYGVLVETLLGNRVESDFVCLKQVCMVSGSGVDHVVHTYLDRM